MSEIESCGVTGTQFSRLLLDLELGGFVFWEDEDYPTVTNKGLDLINDAKSESSFDKGWVEPLYYEFVDQIEPFDTYLPNWKIVRKLRV